MKDIDKFEEQNPEFSISVFGYDKNIYHLRISNSFDDREYKIILLLIEKDGVKHCCLVKDLSRLLSSQVSKHHGKTFFCFRCLNPFQCSKSLDNHREYSKEHEAVNTDLPEPGTIFKFKHYYKEKVPFRRIRRF